MNKFKTFKYRNLSLFFFSVVFALILSRFEGFHSFLLGLGGLGYIGAFLAGALFVCSFTVTSGIVILLVLSESLSPVEIGIIAGLGAVVGDFTIFRFVKDDLSSEIEEIYDHFDPKEHLKHVVHTKYFGWSMPLIGALMIASPLPDEIGVSLLGISKMKNYKFLLLSFVLNAVGIFLVISAALALNP